MERPRGRPPHPGPLTPAEDRVLALVREGLHNAEIAVRLGVSVNTVRYHVANLLGKAGVAERAALQAWQPPRPPDTRRRRSRAWSLPLLAKPWLLAGAAAATACGALAIGVALWPSGGAAEPSAPPLPAGMRPLEADELERGGFRDAGVLLLSTSGSADPVLGGELRDTLSIIALSGAAQVLYDGAFPWHDRGMIVDPNGVFLRGRVGDDIFEVDVRTWSVDAAPYSLDGVMIRPADGGRIVHPAAAGQPPRVMVEARRAIDGAPYRAAIDSRGHLYIARDPLPPDAVFDEWTGTQLDVSGAGLAGRLDKGLIRFTGCDPANVDRPPAGGRPCSVSYQPPGATLLAPVAGTMSCPSAARVELDTGAFVLEFEWANTGYPWPPDLSCTAHAVAAGDEVGPAAHWVITARSADGEPLSVGVGEDGRLWVGHFAPAAGCPCRGGT